MTIWRAYQRQPDGTLRRIVEQHGPANGASGPVRVSGSLVVGEPGWRERKAEKKKGEG